MRIYLAGPISGNTYQECTNWRVDFADLMPESVTCLSPMRGKEFLQVVGEIDGAYPELGPLASSRGIITRDFFDCTRSDIIVANLLTEKISIGTVMEIAWAFQSRTPVIAIMEPGNVHEHPMIDEAIGFRVTSLVHAASIAEIILWP